LNTKLKAYKLSLDQGLDTYEAYSALGVVDDARDFKCAADMLKAMGITRIRLLTNNPFKMNALT
jgi:3,4-dihydroxy 2-butanone 4-phosphate synthase/GTP cyclohydrolase II